MFLKYLGEERKFVHETREEQIGGMILIDSLLCEELCRDYLSTSYVGGRFSNKVYVGGSVVLQESWRITLLGVHHQHGGDMTVTESFSTKVEKMYTWHPSHSEQHHTRNVLDVETREPARFLEHSFVLGWQWS